MLHFKNAKIVILIQRRVSFSVSLQTALCSSSSPHPRSKPLLLLFSLSRYNACLLHCVFSLTGSCLLFVFLLGQYLYSPYGGASCVDQQRARRRRKVLQKVNLRTRVKTTRAKKGWNLNVCFNYSTFSFVFLGELQKGCDVIFLLF